MDNSWKPSVGQLAALEVVLDGDDRNNWFCDSVRELMNSLYEDLKKL